MTAISRRISPLKYTKSSIAQNWCFKTSFKYKRKFFAAGLGLEPGFRLLSNEWVEWKFIFILEREQKECYAYSGCTPFAYACSRSCVSLPDFFTSHHSILLVKMTLERSLKVCYRMLARKRFFYTLPDHLMVWNPYNLHSFGNKRSVQSFVFIAAGSSNGRMYPSGGYHLGSSPSPAAMNGKHFFYPTHSFDSRTHPSGGYHLGSSPNPAALMW